jgi:hypothetical protein
VTSRASAVPFRGLMSLPANSVGRVLKHQLHDDWNGPGTVDSQALGPTLEKSARR